MEVYQTENGNFLTIFPDNEFACYVNLVGTFVKGASKDHVEKAKKIWAKVPVPGNKVNFSEKTVKKSCESVIGTPFYKEKGKNTPFRDILAVKLKMAV